MKMYNKGDTMTRVAHIDRINPILIIILILFITYRRRSIF